MYKSKNIYEKYKKYTISSDKEKQQEDVVQEKEVFLYKLYDTTLE